MLKKIEAFAIGLGAPGIFLIAFLDSSFVALPEAADVLIVWLTIEQPALWLWYGALATAGSVAGSLILYELARRGGEAFLRKRLDAHRVTRSMEIFSRHSLLALIVPSLLPPPVPFKPFVLMAGVSGMSRARFLAAITAGRGVRYIGEALLAYLYGPRAVVYVQENVPLVSGLLGLALLVGAVGYYAFRRTMARR